MQKGLEFFRRFVLAAGLFLFGTVVSAALAADAAPGKVLPAIKAVQSCEALASVDLAAIGGAGSKITAAREKDSNGLKFCEVEGTLAPSIGFRVDLPVSTWTQRYMQIGCGGLCGMINLEVGAASGCVPVTDGNFVLAGTDMGHQGNDASFGRDPQKRVDFAYRAQHLTALVSKTLIAAYYGQKPAYSYFNGCSDGGREAVMEALRYPDDFNGIIAGAPAMLFQLQNSLHHGWLAASNTGPDGKAIVVAPRLALLHKAVLAACDGLDGLKDGLISEPRLCHFDPGSIACKAGTTDTSACLTAAEVGAIRKFYKGPVDPHTGEHLTVGEEQYGSELAWAGVFVPQTTDQPIFSTMIALAALKNLTFEQNPPESYSLADLKFDKATLNLLRARHPLFDAVNPDLSAFRAAGGKLILWHGWADPHISPRTTIAFHEALERQSGKAAVAAFERLYLLPGVYHCGSGEGMAAIDFLSPMMNWVERGEAPDAVVGHTETAKAGSFGQPGGDQKGPPPGAMPPQPEPAVVRSRPVYPYPFLPKYSGKGDVNEAASYVKGSPLYKGLTAKWAGADFFKPYKPMQ